MERFTGLIDALLQKFETVENTLQGLLAKIPGIGDFISNNSNLIILAIVIFLTIFVIKPLVKWSIGIIALGAILAVAISYFTGTAFWGVLPLTALAASIVMFSNRFTMS